MVAGYCREGIINVYFVLRIFYIILYYTIHSKFIKQIVLIYSLQVEKLNRIEFWQSSQVMVFTVQLRAYQLILLRHIIFTIVLVLSKKHLPDL